MSLPSILCTSNFFDTIISSLEDQFNFLSLSQVKGFENQIEGILTTNFPKIDYAFINQFPNLKIISSCSTGVENIDIKTAQQKNIIVTNVPHATTEDTANIAITLLLCLTRNVVAADAYVRAKLWNRHSPFPLGTILYEKTLGIVGLGRIGSRIADKAAAFGLKVIYHSRTQKNVAYPYYKNIIELATDADFLVIACPGGEETKNIITLNTLKALGSRGYIINISRGSTINEDELIFALKNNIIAGAGLDVYLNEPHIREDFLTLQNTILLPHIGSATHETRATMFESAVNNIKSYFETGEVLTPLIKPNQALKRSLTNDQKG